MRVGRWALIAITVLGGFLILGVWITYRILFGDHPDALFVSIEKTDVRVPPVSNTAELVDDRLDDRMPVFDPDLIDSRPVDDWEINTSAAIMRLDVPMIRPDFETALTKLHPNYASAMRENPTRRILLPSANLIDGVGKQFDDGLVAALEVAMFRSEAGDAPAVMDVIRRMHQALPADSSARSYLDAVLIFAGDSIEPSAASIAWQKKLEAQPMSSPAGFYTWNEELKRVWRTFRALQFPMGPNDEAMARELSDALNADPQLKSDFGAVFAFYNSLTNPSDGLSLIDLTNDDRPLEEIASRLERKASVTCLPTATSRETELFSQMFPLGLPAGADLMGMLIRRIRSGEIDLQPKVNEGWYQHQVYALQTLLLTDKNQESSKLVLTANYKRRLLEAFQAMITKRRETHMRSLSTAETAAAAPLEAGSVKPRLRLEPTASFYLRTARAYAFIQNMLTASLGAAKLNEMHGLTQSGTRELSIADELEILKQRYYGFYLVACEDLGMRPQLEADEGVDQEAARASALSWLENFANDPDLAVDTRVCVPIYIDPIANRSRYWGTIGIRLVKLNAKYLTPPSVRPRVADEGESREWELVEAWTMKPEEYLLAVDEFAEFGFAGVQPLTREAFRELCDRSPSKEEFLNRYAQ